MGVPATRIDEINKYLTYETLYELYTIQGYSAYYISKHYFKPNFICSVNVVINRLKYYNIATRNIYESAKMPKRNNLCKQTCFEKYGVENISHVADIKNKKELSALNKYGVKNVFQSEIIKAKSKETMYNNYGVYSPCFLSHRSQNGFRSKPHIILENILDELNIKYLSDIRKPIFSKFNQDLKREYSPCPDLILPEVKIIIECYGNYWHCNPILYSCDDIVYKYEGSINCNDIWNFDKIRKEHLESFGYKVIIFWEEDINKNPIKIKEIINEYCKNI